MKPRMVLALSLAAAGLIVAGCGSDSSSSTTTAALTKSEFLAKGNAICAKGNKEINQAANQTFQNNQKPSASEVNQFATKTLIPSIQEQINGIKALPAPSGDEAQVTAIVTGAQEALDKAKANPKLLTQNSSTDPFADVNKLTNAYGLTKCGGGG